MNLYMNTSLRGSKYKLHDRFFSTACSAIHPESLDELPLILILLQIYPPTPSPANVCLRLKSTSLYTPYPRAQVAKQFFTED